MASPFTGQLYVDIALSVRHKPVEMPRISIIPCFFIPFLFWKQRLPAWGSHQVPPEDWESTGGATLLNQGKLCCHHGDFQL